MFDYINDVLILAGDVSDQVLQIEKAFLGLSAKFMRVFYVPGNHDLWIIGDKHKNSIEKLHTIEEIARNTCVVMKTSIIGDVAIVPLYGWYDYSFGIPCDEIFESWMDYMACKWPFGNDMSKVSEYFNSLNVISQEKNAKFTISFSHFVPRIDLMPFYIPEDKKKLYPVLGSTLLEKQIREVNSDVHIYGHSHVNNQVEKEGLLYINNAFGYPHEGRITAKALKLHFSTDFLVSY